LFLPLLAITGLCLETNLLTTQETQKRVPMTHISDFVKWPISVRTPDFVLTSSEPPGPPFSLRGHDKRGRPWKVILQDAARKAWQSVDRGLRTYYFAGYTGAAGSGPGTWILVLSFDDVGQPVPFYVITHGSIEDVVNLDGSGPELLEQDYWGSMMDDPGYYVTVLYRQEGYYWRRSDGRHGAHMFPAFEKWSVMWKDRPAELTANPHPQRPVRDSSNDPAEGIHTTISSAQGSSIRVTPAVGCKEVDVQVLVTDSAKGRRIDLQPETGSLVNLARAHTSVSLTGLYRWPGGKDCDASIVWAIADR
jgi:hypothetical protein